MRRGGSAQNGDAGFTSLGDGTRVSKDSARVAAYGAVDELDAFAGLARVEAVQSVPPSTDRDLVITAIEAVQSACWVLAACLADPTRCPGDDAVQAVARIESLAMEAGEAAGPLKRFVIPGVSRAEAELHVARTVCRRAERLVVGLYAGAGEGSRWEIVLLNRMSALLFDAARLVLKCQGLAPDLRGRTP